MDERTGGWMDWMDGWTDGWIEGGMDGWMDGWMNLPFWLQLKSSCLWSLGLIMNVVYRIE